MFKDKSGIARIAGAAGAPRITSSRLGCSRFRTAPDHNDCELLAQQTFLADLAEGAFLVEWGRDFDLVQAREICSRYRTLRLGLVDAMVISTAEQLKAGAIATLDLTPFRRRQDQGEPEVVAEGDLTEL